jgi:hypothetical protein
MFCVLVEKVQIMNISERKKLYQKALTLWGKYSQMDMILEESSELIVECGKLIRNIVKLSRTKSKKQQAAQIMLIEAEIADLEIMLEQAHLIFDGKFIDKIKEEKLNRLKSRMGRH